MKLLLDTDIGGDIDDAVALAYLLCQPRCALLGVTTVGGQAERRAALASAVCHAASRSDVPIHVGASQPLLVAERQTDAYQGQALGPQWPHRTFAATNTAVEFLRDAIRAHPGAITLLAIGPLTNIGLLFALDPEIPSLLQQLMLVGGSPTAVTAEEEWNILCDPHAAARVLASPLPITSVGCNVTARCHLPADECRRRFAAAGGPFDFVAAMAEVYFAAETPEIFFHDPLAAALLFAPESCRTQPGRIEVEIYNPARLGRTRFNRADEQPPHHFAPHHLAPHHLAVEVDPPRFFEHLFTTIGATA